jgi:hypothetical protein
MEILVEHDIDFIVAPVSAKAQARLFDDIVNFSSLISSIILL